MAVSEIHKEYIFSYGTLQLEATQLKNYGRLLVSRKDTLLGYKLTPIKIDDEEVIALSGTPYHNIAQFTGLSSDQIDGAVLEMTMDEILKTDEYEGPEFKRISVSLQSGIQSWVYVKA